MTAAWTSLSELVRSTYRRHPDRTAVTDEHGAELTYRELSDCARRVAGWMRERGVRPGDRVMVVAHNRAEWLILEHAIALGGLVRTCLGPRLHAREVAGIVDDAEPALLIVDAAWSAGAAEDFFGGLRCPVIGVGWAAAAALPSTVAFRFEDMLTADPLSDADLPAVSADDLAYLLYTSGSTGAPKGVVHTHASICASAQNTVWALGGVGPADSAVHSAPLAHMSGTVAMALTAVGGANRLLEKFSPATTLDAVTAGRATILPVVPTMLNAIVDELAGSPRSVDGVSRVVYAGSAITADRLEHANDFFAGKLVQLYGLSEAPMPITALLPADHTGHRNSLGLARFASAGRPAPNVRVRIVGADQQRLPAGEPGEIVIDSPSRCRGYWRNDAATAQLFDADGSILAGDIGVLDEDGYLFIVDRTKDMIVSGGFNVYPREVENALSTMAGVAAVAVVGAPDERWGECVVAVVVPVAGASITLAAIQDHTRERISGYKIPRRLVIRESLPTGSTGKVLKRALSDEFWAGSARRVGGAG